MKKSINGWSIPSDVGFEDTFKQIKAAGFDGIELNVDAKGGSAHAFYPGITDKELADIKALSDKYALPVISVSTSLWGGLMGSDKAEVREQGKELLRCQLKCAKAMSADGILVVPGGMSADITLKQAHANCRVMLKEMKAEIEASKIHVGVENVWNGFFMSPFDMVSFIDDIGSEYVGAYFDVGNVAVFSEPEEWIDILGSRIVKVHVKDWKRTQGRFSGTWANLLEGTINWAAVKAAFEKTGFDGYLTAELGITRPDPGFLYRITSDALSIITK